MKSQGACLFKQARLFGKIRAFLLLQTTYIFAMDSNESSNEQTNLTLSDPHLIFGQDAFVLIHDAQIASNSSLSLFLHVHVCVHVHACMHMLEVLYLYNQSVSQSVSQSMVSSVVT